ncbi:MAG: hypothetical protein MUC31_02890 [Bacteroidales bacterium]|jgi:hypothetical protein|nr:hypothetical protein [Bacteroidales bacterium]
MKLKLFFLMLFALALFSCQKEKTDPVTEQEVTFTATLLTPDVGLKSTTDAIPCKSDVPDYAAVKISGTWYYPALFTLDGQLYTQAIKFPVGTYTVEEFFLYKNVGGTTAYDDGDVIVFATPLAGTQYAEFVSTPLTFTFTVEAFKKAQIEIEVLCFQDHLYTSFGFMWFHITEIVVREQCFFGDICFKHYLDYAGSHYALQPGGLKIDMPAIMMIKVYKNGVLLPAPYDSFTNDVAPNYGEGAPLCIVYPDNLSITGEVFTVELYIMVKQGVNFPFLLFHTFTFMDDQMIAAGADGVVDFVLGNCNLTTPDLQLAPYMNLPATCVLTTGNSVPGVVPLQGSVGYFDVTLAGIAAGYDLVNGLYGVNCFNQGVTINLGTTYNMNVYNSLYPELMMGNCALLPWDKANWIINHLANFPGYAWYDIQQALWMLENPLYDGLNTHGGTVPAITSNGLAMVAGANANGSGYVPLPGGWAAVAFEPSDGSTLQCIFTRVDP